MSGIYLQVVLLVQSIVSSKAVPTSHAEYQLILAALQVQDGVLACAFHDASAGGPRRSRPRNELNSIRSFALAGFLRQPTE